ncbi:MAG: PIG-L family deacetylase [Thermoanaerobaculia bacterium]
MSVISLSVALCVVTAVASPRVRAARPGPDLARILWIGAHPDDETLIAPLLGHQCVDGSSSCALVVMTRGENGECALPGGCSPDLGAVRTMEMQSAAALFRARLTQWSFSDVMQSVDAIWSAEAGSHDLLVRQIAAVMESERPTIVITFDPNHGSSCHAAHRAVGELVLEAAALVSNPPPVYLVETRDIVANGAFVFTNAVSSSPTITTYGEATSWHFLIEDVRTHASQFTPAQADALDALPSLQKQVYLMPASAMATARYDAICP